MSAICTSVEPSRICHAPAVHRKLRNAYIAGEGSIRQLAELHGIPEDTVRNWCRREKWGGLRSKFDTRDNERLVSLAAPVPQRVIEAPAMAKTPAEAKLDAVEAQLKKVDRLMAESEDYKELEALSRAKERFLNQWCILTGFPRPGVRRQTKQKSSQSFQPLEPLTPTGSSVDAPQEPVVTPDWHQFTG